MKSLDLLKCNINDGTIEEEKVFYLASEYQTAHPYKLRDINETKSYEEYYQLVKYLIDNDIKFTNGGSMKNEDLCTLIQNGDDMAAYLLVKNNEYLISSCIDRYDYIDKYKDDKDNSSKLNLDLAQECRMAIIQKAQEYDPSYGASFATYVGYKLKDVILTYIEKNKYSMNIPSNVQDKLNDISSVRSKLNGELGRYPTYEEIAIASGKYDAKEVAELLEVKNMVDTSCSLDSTIDEDGNDTLINHIDVDQITPEEYAETEEIKDVLSKMINDLDDIERKVLNYEFGLYDKVNYSYSEIARKLNISENQVRAISHRALRRLQDPEYYEVIKDYIK